LLERLASRPLFVVSGTPEDEMRQIVHLRGLEHLFAGVYGSPSSKSANIQRIQSDHGLSSEGLLVVGDALSDYEGARALALPFVARVPPGHMSPFPAGGVLATVGDLAELDRRWPSIEEAVLRWRT
jgi:phosphoglycolate phosphatase-like HAD superfamily hydrolase